VFFPENPSQPAYTIERPGCCCDKPCLGCCACGEACQDKMIVHNGMAMGEVGAVTNPSPIMVIQQAPCSQAMFEPTIQVIPTGASAPTTTITGPCLFGGCSELCFDSHFLGKNASGGALGQVKKLKPKTCCECCTECVSDIDRYDLQFTNTASPDEKAQMALATFMVDYMLFEQDNGMCKRRSDGTVACTLFQCYCCGCIVPCNLYCKANGEGA